MIFFFGILNFLVCLKDAFTSDDGKYINKDSQQDCKIIRVNENSVAFRRKIDTCDPLDLAMHVSSNKLKIVQIIKKKSPILGRNHVPTLGSWNRRF